MQNLLEADVTCDENRIFVKQDSPDQQPSTIGLKAPITFAP